MRRLLFLIMTSTVLYGCGGTGEEPGSSSSSSSSSSSGVVNPPVGDGDPVAGASKFESTCSSCHAYQGQGVFGNVAIGGSNGDPFSIEDLLSSSGYDDVEGLAEYIETSMPYGNGAGCAGSCAADTAAFMASKLSDISDGPVVAACSSDDPVTYGVRTLRPLTASEYRNTIVQAGLISKAEAEDVDLPGDVVRTKSNYVVHSALRIEGTRATAFDKAAFKVAELAVPKLLQNCGSNANTCADRFLTLAFELHRQPLEQDEKDLYRGLFNEFGAESGMSVALAAALTSPQFIYRSEMGIKVSEARNRGWNTPNLNEADSNAYVLNPYEFASQLSFMYTGTGPTADLLNKAGNGDLNSDSNVESVINDLISSATGRSHIEQFGGIWFRADDVVDESRPSFNQFTPEVAKDMSEEVRKLFAHVWYSNDLTLEDLYGGDFTVVNNRLAQFYGVNNFNGGNNSWNVTNIPNRGGVLTTGAFHAAYANDLHTRPILKAVKVRELMLCHHIGAPQNMLADDAAIAENQASIVSTLQAGSGNASAREYYEASTIADGCQVCHRNQINPLFGLDDFDQIGLPRSTQTGLRLVSDQGLFEAGNSGVQVDDSGELVGLSSLSDTSSISFNGAKDLGKKIASLPTVAECMVINSFRYTTGLAIDRDSVAKNGTATIREDELNDEQVEDFACAKEILTSAYESSGKKPMEVYRKIGSLDLIRFRK